MNRIVIGTLGLLILISAVSCVSVQAIKRGGELKADTSYVALMFSDKTDIMSVAKRIVFAVIQQKDSASQYFVPFGVGDELRVISIPTGKYFIADFVYLGGIGVASVDPFRLPGVITSKPQYANTILITAGYPEEYRKEFSLESGEIVFLGYFSTEYKLNLMEHATLVNRNTGSDLQAQILVNDAYPIMSSSMKISALP